MWRWICQVLKTDTLKVFSEYNTGEQTIWSYQSQAQRYDLSNRASDWSAVLTTSETLKIVNGIMFENWLNGFVISSNLGHIKSLTPKTWCKRNFVTRVNWSRFMARQTGLPRNMEDMQIYNRDDWPTLRGSKPSQNMSKRLEIWNIGSQICMLNILKVAGYDS